MVHVQPKVVAVVVAFNRRDLLAQTLDGLAAQHRRADAVIVIDNASEDDSAAVARNHAVTDEVLTMPTNLGGAGGFAAGIARAVTTHQADLVWIMDDDTVPTPGALAGLMSARESYPGQPAVLASKAVWIDGREHPMNRPRPRPLLSPEQARHAKDIGVRPIRSASFVSIMIDVRAVLEDGLPQADYFLWNDDFEYTARLLRHRVGLYVPYSEVVHKTKVFGNSSADPGPRFVNEVRNKVWMYTRSSALNPLETVLYGGKSVLRWVRTVATSEDPRALLTYGRDGLKQALKSPQTTASILADTPVGEDARAIERRTADRRRMVGDVGLNPLELGEDPTSARTGLGSLYAEAAGGPFRDVQSHAGTSGEDTSLPLFAVLTSVYHGDDADQFRRALQSVTRDQTLKPNQVVLVQDGLVPEDLAQAIADRDRIAGQSVDLVVLKHNSGLARALQAGMEVVQTDVIARADADDVSLPHRFARQIPLMATHDLVGSAIAEFVDDEDDWGMIRILPQTSADIERVARFRDPFNHPTVVMRRSALEHAGGYEHLERMEDYWLFARMIHAGARATNVAEPLVAYRVGDGAYDRRGGWDLAKSEWQLQRNLRRIGFTTPTQFARNMVVRGGYRLIPTFVRKALYKSVGTLAWFKEEPRD